MNEIDKIEKENDELKEYINNSILATSILLNLDKEFVKDLFDMFNESMNEER